MRQSRRESVAPTRFARAAGAPGVGPRRSALGLAIGVLVGPGAVPAPRARSLERLRRRQHDGRRPDRWLLDGHCRRVRSRPTAAPRRWGRPPCRPAARQAHRRDGAPHRTGRLLARGLRRRHLQLRRRRVLRLDRRHAPQQADRRHGGDARRPGATGSSPPTAASSATATPTFYGSTGSIAPQQARRRHGCHHRRQRLLARGLRRRHLQLRRRRLLRLDGGHPPRTCPIVGMAPTADGAGTGSSASTAGSSPSATPVLRFDGGLGHVYAYGVIDQPQLPRATCVVDRQRQSRTACSGRAAELRTRSRRSLHAGGRTTLTPHGPRRAWRPSRRRRDTLADRGQRLPARQQRMGGHGRVRREPQLI